ncbi:MAG: DnaA regulatory inactivator Hda [Candidatus Kinetoplastibacterium crithidii]|nr:DnaA regulatory inactivator Hda [Candidatus Kinetoplastibacterium crithidii]
MKQHQLILNILPNIEPSLSNYILGINTEAVHAAKSIKGGRALYIWGDKGSGKSHILQAITNERNSTYINHTNCYKIFNLAINNEVESLPKLIAIDDVHLLNNSQQSGLFSLYNRWRELSQTEKSFAMILSGDKKPILMNVREDLKTRLGWDISFRIEPLSDKDKLNALKTLGNKLGIRNLDNVIQWMLKYCNRDIKYLMNLLTLLNKYSISTKRPITINLLRTMLKESESIQI